MPAGLSINDFYYVLPEIILTFGALVLAAVPIAFAHATAASIAILVAD